MSTELSQSQTELLENFKQGVQRETEWFKSNRETLQKDHEMSNEDWDEMIWEKETQDKYQFAYVSSICKASWFVEQQKASFGEIDANKDGNLTLDELRKNFTSKLVEMGMTEEMLAQNPEAVDGFISSMFKGFDLDGNNKISFDEYLVIAAASRFSAKMEPEVVVQYVPVPIDMDLGDMTTEQRRSSVQLPGGRGRGSACEIVSIDDDGEASKLEDPTKAEMVTPKKGMFACMGFC